MNDVIKLGNNQPLTKKDLFPLLENYKAEVPVKTAGKRWLKESRRKTTHLWKAIALEIISDEIISNDAYFTDPSVCALCLLACFSLAFVKGFK